MSRNLYLVPHDFTAVGDAALNYAFLLGRKVKTEIKIVHIVSDKAKLALAKQKMDALIEKSPKDSNVELTYLLKVGSIFEDIGNIAKREYAQLIIMGTHGVTGMQKIFGSYAIKVLTTTNIPFLIVQKDTVIKDVKNIVVPIDSTKESLQIANPAGDMAGIFQANIHVISERQRDEILARKMQNRIKIIKDQYDDRGLESHFVFLEESGSFFRKINNYIKKVEGDFIALAYHSESLFPQFDTFAQNLMTNDFKIPCLIINSKEASNMYF
jgi:nucleotide-binding universal stress UspA family protein